MPPANFDSIVFDRLAGPASDVGVGQLFQHLEHTATVPIPVDWALDIDTREDLAQQPPECGMEANIR
ncbi:hypothetical protein [Vreelandella titanicae]|uniref:hypothetical protein n=1 Tax=Vreelandella titanicae TaxID=664683 RepID=UPI001AD725F5|nr:hypothetical protein [Halomonas titanicae]